MPATSLIPRHATLVALEMLAESRAVALVGPRQSGKSTLARDLLADRWPARYLTLDHEDTRAAALGDPRGFIERIESSVIIDEIQRAPDLMLAIKARLDIDNSPGQFLITGSANLTRIRTVQDALPGRVLYLEIWPLSQAEIEGHGTSGIHSLMSGKIPSVKGARFGVSAYVERFIRGGFPGAFRSSARVRGRFFDSYLASIVELDIPELSALRTIDGPAKVLRLLASRSAGLLNVASLARDLQVDNKTVDHHLRILRDLMLVRIHPPWFANLGSRQIKTPKVYITDPGLMASLVRSDAGGFDRNPVLLGSFLETAVCMEIVRGASVSEQHVGVYHYRDKKQREVDIVLERPDGSIVAIEVKANTTARPGDFRTLRYLRDGLGDRFLAGVLLNCGDQTHSFGDRLASMPISGLWES